MINPIDCHELFQISNNCKITFSEKDQVVYVDNFFKNYNDIVQLTEHAMVDKWKGSHPDSRNYIDYYDCRLTYGYYDRPSHLQGNYDNLFAKVNEHLKLTIDGADPRSHTYNLQMFKHRLSGRPNYINFFPHHDPIFVNLIVYLDEHCSGGTAVYETHEECPYESEDINTMVDLRPFNIELITKAQPNRAVLFDGRRLHGGYIHNHDVYYNNWRKSVVMFLPFAG